MHLHAAGDTPDGIALNGEGIGNASLPAPSALGPACWVPPLAQAGRAGRTTLRTGGRDASRPLLLERCAIGAVSRDVIVVGGREAVEDICGA